MTGKSTHTAPIAAPTTNGKRHHGNLRQTLINAGIDILGQDGLSALTLRACAARAGVSHAAPAHHFSGLPGLQAGIAAKGYTLLVTAMTSERAKVDPRATARLLAICQGYLHFAQAYPALFTLMFSTDVFADDCHTDPDLAAASTAAYGILAEACAAFDPGPIGASGLEIMIWSLIHGYASLMQHRRIGAESLSPAGVAEFDTILATLKLREK